MLPDLTDSPVDCRGSFNGEFEEDKWIKEVPYPNFPLQSNSDVHDELTVTFPGQSKVTRFVQEIPDSSSIPSTNKVVPRKIVHAMPKRMRDKKCIDSQETKSKESKLQKKQSISNDWNPCINHIVRGSSVCLPTRKFGIKTETTSHGQLSPKAGLRMSPDLTESPVNCGGCFSGEFEQEKWIEEVPYPYYPIQFNSNLHDELMVTFSDHKLTLLSRILNLNRDHMNIIKVGD